MSQFGLTDTGFRRKRFDDVLSGMESRAETLFGKKIDLSSRSPLAKILRLVCWVAAQLWALAERVYHSGYVESATGAQLDAVVRTFSGIRRKPAAKAVGTLTITGDPATEIPAGFLVDTDSLPPVRFRTTHAVTIPGGGEVDVEIEAVNPGAAGNVAAETITVIVNPTAGVGAVMNAGPTAGGQDRETDAELQFRHRQSLARGGASTREAIRSSIMEAPGVRQAFVFHNIAMDEDGEGRPPKSVEAVVLGGTDMEVAKAILDSLAAGIEPFGEVEVQVPDIGGELQTIRFNRPGALEVFVTVTVDATPEFPVDGEDQVRDQIVAYIGGMDSNGTVHPGTGIGEDVVHSRVIDAAHNVPGTRKVTVVMGLEEEYQDEVDIEVGIREVAETSVENIAVVIVD